MSIPQDIERKLHLIYHKSKSGIYKTEAEFRQEFVEWIRDLLKVMRIETSRELERKLITGRPDTRVGRLIFEFENPQLGPSISQSELQQLRRYIHEASKKLSLIHI